MIVLLTQIGNIGGLFRTRDSNKVEEIAIKITSAIDEEKIHALLGKTLDGKTVRKRLSEIDFWTTQNTLSFTSRLNLAVTDESTYDEDSEITKSWSLAGLEFELYECSPTAKPLDGKKIGLEFKNDSIKFITDNSAVDIPNHIVLLLKHIHTAHEIHIDRRTGLTFERQSPGKNTDGSWQVLCN